MLVEVTVVESQATQEQQILEVEVVDLEVQPQTVGMEVMVVQALL